MTRSGATAAVARLAILVAMASPPAIADDALPLLVLPAVGLRAADLALVVNDGDPASVETGSYYAERRRIPPERVIHVRFPAGQPVMSLADFERVKGVVEARAAPDVQALALAWTLPFRVECMSVTAAFALGFDRASCAEGCKPTKPSPYFASESHAPWTDLRLRPAMLLAGSDVASVKRLIDRGLRSDERWPTGTAYLVSTSDGKRNVRAETYARARRVLSSAYPIAIVDADELAGRGDVMFYFTGIQRVTALSSNRFLDGAMGDHLTSLGGVLTGAGQTTALEWLAAGATGSYGTTSEPCNFREKFPDIAVAMVHYLGGESLVEAYWKSLQMPGQGVFVGDPLARPFGGVRARRSGSEMVFETRSLAPGRYELQAARSNVGPFRPVGSLVVTSYGARRLAVPAADPRHFRVLQLPELPRMPR